MNIVSQRPWLLRRRLVATVLIALAALAAVARPASAAEPLYVGQVCSSKEYHNMTHLCGIAPFRGNIAITNTGVHQIAIFALRAEIDTSTWDGTFKGAFSATDRWSFDYAENIPVGAWVEIEVLAGDRLYIARSDHTLSYRTITLRVDYMYTPPLQGAPSPGPSGPEDVPAQSMQAMLDGLICPQGENPGSLTALGVMAAITATTHFGGESCLDLSELLESGMDLLVDVTLREHRSGILSATAMELATGVRPGRRRGHQQERE